MLRYVVVIALVGLMIFTIVDIALIDRSRVRTLPKGIWLLIAILPLLGPALWFLVGRLRDGRARPARRSGPLAPDDDAAFLARLQREQDQRDRIRDLEQQLADLDDDDPEPGSGPGPDTARD